MVIDDTQERRLPWFLRLPAFFLQRLVFGRIWYVHYPVVLIIRATPEMILKALGEATRPSVQRLHQRNLFLQGRRYFLRAEGDGFRLTTTHSIRWRYRRRTSSVTVMRGRFSSMGGEITRIHLRVRINVGYLLDTFLVPAFMTSLLVYMTWSPLFIAGVLVLLYGLSWVGHRANARLEGAELVWFVQQALDDLPSADIAALATGSDDVININQDFEQEWEKFYREHREK